MTTVYMSKTDKQKYHIVGTFSKSNGKIVKSGKMDNVPVGVLCSYIMTSLLSVPFLSEIRKHSCEIYRLVFFHPSKFSKSVATVRLHNVKLREVVHKYQLLYWRKNDIGWSFCAINRGKVTLFYLIIGLFGVYMFYEFFQNILMKNQNRRHNCFLWLINWLTDCWLTDVNQYFIYSNYTGKMVALGLTFRKQTLENTEGAIKNQRNWQHRTHYTKIIKTKTQTQTRNAPPSFYNLEVKTNRTSFLCGSRRGHYQMELRT
jgi:hypothetical protein